MADPNIGEVATATWNGKIGTKPTDNVFNSRAFFYSMNKNGFKEEVGGGSDFELSVEFAENPNMRAMGEADELDTTRVSNFDAARFNQKIVAGTVVLSWLQELRNTEPGRKFDLVAEKLENGKDTMYAVLNRQFLGDGSAADDVDGIQDLISTTPTTGTRGGISSATYTWWRSRQNSGAQSATAYDNLRSALTTTYNQCSLGGIKNTPRWVLTDRTSFQGYETILVAIEQFADARMKESGDIAFDNEMLKFKAAKMFYDEDAPAGNAYLYNNTNLKVAYLRGGWMKMFPPRDPHNQLMTVHKVATVCNLVSNALRHLGVVNAIS